MYLNIVRRGHTQRLLAKMQKFLSIITDPNDKVLVCIDFDELITLIHATRMFDQWAELRRFKPCVNPEALKLYGPTSFRGVFLLNSLFCDMKIENWNDLILEISETPFRPGFEDFIKALLNDQRFTVIIISSGLLEVCYAIMKQIDFPKENIFAGILNVDSNSILNPFISMSEDMKGLVVQELSQHFLATIGVGHSHGDLSMLKKCDFAISFGDELKGMTTYNFGWNQARECLEKIQQMV